MEFTVEAETKYDCDARIRKKKTKLINPRNIQLPIERMV